MEKSVARERIDFLRREIAFHENLYRVKNSPQISDDQFDALMHELRFLEAEFPEFYDPNSPSVRVGNDLSSSFVSVAHLSPMLSLDNVFDSSELEDFDARRKSTAREFRQSMKTENLCACLPAETAKRATILRATRLL